jgi:hypothetical protein
MQKVGFYERVGAGVSMLGNTLFVIRARGVEESWHDLTSQGIVENGILTKEYTEILSAKHPLVSTTWQSIHMIINYALIGNQNTCNIAPYSAKMSEI